MGTAALCFIGCGAIVLDGYPAAFPIGSISGCHVNPVVSIAMVVAGRMPASDLLACIAAPIWLCIAALIVGAVIAGILFKANVLSED